MPRFLQPWLDFDFELVNFGKILFAWFDFEFDIVNPVGKVPIGNPQCCPGLGAASADHTQPFWKLRSGKFVNGFEGFVWRFTKHFLPFQNPENEKNKEYEFLH